MADKVMPNKEIPMNHSVTQAALSLTLCALLASPLLTAQQPMQVASISLSSQLLPATQPAASTQQVDAPNLSAVAERDQALKSARTLHICSETMFLTTGALDRALMKEKNWDKLGLNIVSNPGRADLELQVNRVIHPCPYIHSYREVDRHRSRLGQSHSIRRSDCFRPHG
jgi:hypothetical protein